MRAGSGGDPVVPAAGSSANQDRPCWILPARYPPIRCCRRCAARTTPGQIGPIDSHSVAVCNCFSGTVSSRSVVSGSRRRALTMIGALAPEYARTPDKNSRLATISQWGPTPAGSGPGRPSDGSGATNRTRPTPVNSHAAAHIAHGRWVLHSVIVDRSALVGTQASAFISAWAIGLPCNRSSPPGGSYARLRPSATRLPPRSRRTAPTGSPPASNDRWASSRHRQTPPPASFRAEIKSMGTAQHHRLSRVRVVCARTNSSSTSCPRPGVSHGTGTEPRSARIGGVTTSRA
jgi:hypothetical protein